jgi:hypothetical protein
LLKRSVPFEGLVGDVALRDPVVADPARGLDFEAFFEDIYERLFQALLLTSGDRAEAEDLAQEAMVRAYERWDRVKAANSPAAYVFRTAFNLNRFGDGLLVSCQTEGLRGDLQDLGWERVDRVVGNETFVLRALEHAGDPPFTVWPELHPIRTLGATFEGFYLCMQTDFLSRDDLLDTIASVEVVGHEEDS